VQICTEAPSEEVVAKQKEPGNAAQSASVWQPGMHSLPELAVATHAFGRPRPLPPPAPSPAQSEERAQARVHHNPLQERPELHVSFWAMQGSPIPDSLQTGHFASRHDVSSSRRPTPSGD
jgi:hypothetical protein